LQELLASEYRQFFDSTWQPIEFGSERRARYLEVGLNPGCEEEDTLLSEITGIEIFFGVAALTFGRVEHH
jgi:hypothetical protein